jgi:hypothetical protein
MLSPERQAKKEKLEASLATLFEEKEKYGEGSPEWKKVVAEMEKVKQKLEEI